MGKTIRSLLAATVAGLMLPAAATSAVGVDTDTDAGPADRRVDGPSALAAPAEPVREPAPTELLVRFRAGTSASERADVRADVDGRLLDRLPVPGLELVHVGSDATTTARALERRPDVLYAEPNFTATIAATPDDPELHRLWGLHNTGQSVNGHSGVADADIDAPEAWEHTTGDPAVTVAVVDSGVAIEHPDLAANVWKNTDEVAGDRVDNDNNGYVDDVHGWDWVDGDETPDDFNGHGTHVAGTIGAVSDNGIGIAGVTWDVSLMPLRALGPDGSGSYDAILEAFAYAGRNGAEVVNASLGGAQHSEAMADVVKRFPGTLFVVAAGNDNSDNDATPSFPCNISATNLVCVAATDNQDRLTDFSNYGATSVHIAAPGESIRSTVPAETTVWTEHFEDAGWSTRWTSGGSARWGLETDDYGGFLSDSPAGPYANGANTWVRPVAPMDFSGGRNCTVDYWLALDVEPSYDHLWIEASTDRVAWTSLTSRSEFQGPWLQVRDSLAAFDGERSVYLRFRLESDDTGYSDGVWIDDVSVACQYSYDGDEYSWMSGTSMASPQVAGAAALLYAADPEATVGDVRTALLEGVDPLSSLTGKTVTGGRLNVHHALDLLVGHPTGPADPDRPADTTAPETSMESAPGAGTTERTATFSFSASEAGSSFSCSLDAQPYTACGSPVEYTGLVPGPHTFRVRATDADGNTDPTPAAHAWAIDNAAPSDVRVGGFRTPYSPSTQLRVFPQARDTHDGIDHFDVRYRAAGYDTGYSAWSTLDSGVPADWGVRMSVPSGYTVCYSARATDVYGAASTWSAGRCTAVPVDDRDLARSAGWTRPTARGAFRGTLTVSSRRGAALSTPGAGIRRVALVVTRAPRSGTVDVYLGSRRLKRVSLAAARTHRKQVIPVATWASPRNGNFRVVVTTSGKPVRIDGLALGR